MSSATRSLKGWSRSKSCSGGTGSSGVPTEQPGRGVDGGLPRNLFHCLGRRAIACFGKPLHGVEVHIRKSTPLLFVERDPCTSALGCNSVTSDPFPEGRVLVSLIVAQNEPGVA